MSNFVYPASDLDRAKALLRVLGSFWASSYEAKDQLKSLALALAAGTQQNVDNLNETVDALSRHDIQIFHTENWLPLTFKKSELNVTAANNYKFDGDSINFDDSPPIIFDALKTVNFYALPISDKFVTAAQLYDRILFPTLSLTADSDFIVSRADAAIIFKANPFELPGVIASPIYENGEIVDESITLWAFKAQIDHNKLFSQFAYAIQARLSSLENSKQFLNAIFDGLIAGGATAAVLDAALSAVFDVPLVKTPGEVVEIISLDNHGLFIATDKNVYRFAASATPVVSVGDVLPAGARLINAFEVVNLNRGNIPAAITALALDQGFTAACYHSDLIFENKEVPLHVDTQHPLGRTYVKFPLGGFKPDVDRFFDEIHTRGIESLQIPVQPGCAPPPRRTGTLAHVLDKRKTPIGEPSADDLPTTINPLKFLIENVLKNNTAIVLVRVSELGKNKLGLYNIRHIRQLLPPHMALIFNYIIAGRTDAIAPEDSLTEDLRVFTGMEPLTDAVPDVLIQDRGVMVRVISGSCQ